MAENAKSTLLDADDLRPIIKFLGKNWYLLIGIPAAAFAIAYFYTHRLSDIYAAKTEILLKSSETYDYQSQIYSNVGYYALYNDITNQKRILSSYDLISKTLDKLDFNISYYLVGRVKTSQVAHIEAINISTKETVLKENELYNQPINIKILGMDKFALSYELNGNTIIHEHGFGEQIETEHYKIRIDRNPFFTEQTIRSISNQDFQIRIHHPTQLINKYKSSLDINQVERTSILTLTLVDELPQRAKMFLDTLSQEYIAYSLESQVKVNENTQDYIQKQLDELTGIIDSLEYELERYKQNKGILDLTREQKEYFDQLLLYEKEKRQLDLRIESVDAIVDYVTSSYDEKLLPPAIYVFDQDDFLKESLNKLYELHMTRKRDLIDYTEKSTQVQRVDSVIHGTSKNIVDYLKNTRVALKERVKDISGEIRYYESLVQGVPKSQRDVLGIQRKLEVNESLYVFLLEKKANTVIARAAIIPQTSIIETARGLGIVGPDKSRTHYTAIGIGMLIAIVIGLIRLLFFERIENTRELRQIAKLPVIGGIPNYNEAETEPLAVNNQPKSNVAESFRSLRTNTQYMLPGTDTKIILVTSLHPGEGKTFTSSNISAIYAKAGKKVLLLDFDMHKPKVHKTFGLENVSGISSYLIGKSDWQDCVIPSQVENLDLITAGPVPPNASELVLSAKVEELLEQTKLAYDLIVVDTPPLMLISDSLVLLKLVDLGIFVMNTEKATKQGVRHLEEILLQNKLEHNCLILNNVKQKRWKYYYGKYAYKYGYGYGYGYAYGYGYGHGYGAYGLESAPKKRKSKRSRGNQSN